MFAIKTNVSALLATYLFYCCVITTSAFSYANATNETTVNTIYQFPKGTWIENIAVRPNGQLLLTLLNAPELYLLDPTLNQPPTLVYRFPYVLGLSGIAEIAPDVFAVGAGNYSLATGKNEPGSWSVWRVDLSDSSASSNGTLTPASSVSKIADVTEAAFINGMSQLSQEYLLLGDILGGVVFRLDINTGAYTQVIADALTAVVPQPLFGSVGIDGLHARDDGFLYFASAGKNIFAKIPIHADGTPAGNASVITSVPASTDYYDDFAFGRKTGAAYLVTGSGNSIEKVSRNGHGEIIAGSLNSTAIAEPTSCAFGRGVTDQGILYVITSGGLAAPVNGNITVGAQVVAVDVPWER